MRLVGGGDRVAAVGLAMLTVAPLVSLGRALLALSGRTEPDSYWILFAVGGTLAGAGMLLATAASFGNPRFLQAMAGTVVAFTGHNVVVRVAAAATFGPALVQLGSGIVLAAWVRWALVPAILAAVGAVLRSEHWSGHAGLAIGSAGLAAAAVQATRRAWSGALPATAAAAAES